MSASSGAEETPITYVTMDSLSEGVGASQVLAYVRELAGRGVPVELHTFEKGAPSELTSEELSRHGVDWQPHAFGSPGAVGGLGRVVRASRAMRGVRGVVHARSDPVAAAALLARADPWIWDMRSFWREEREFQGQLAATSPESKIFRAIERMAAHRASAIIVLAKAAIGELEARYPDANVGEKSVVIPTCVDMDAFKFRPPPDTPPYVAMLSGTLNRYYDVPLTLRFVEEWRRSDDVELRVVAPGETPWDDLLAPYTTSRKAVTPAMMPLEVSRSHVGLSICKLDAGPSLKARMPTKIAEFLATGRPVVVSAGLGDMDEIVERSQCGVVVSSSASDHLAAKAAELRRLLAEPEVARRCREAAERYFDLASGVDSLLAVYRQLSLEGSLRRR